MACNKRSRFDSCPHRQKGKEMKLKGLFEKIDKSFICHYLFLLGVGVLTLVLQFSIVENIMILIKG